MKAKERLQSVRRLLAVQEQMHRLAEWKLATTKREAVALEERQTAMMEFLDGDTALPPVFAAAAMSQLRALGTAREAMQKRQEGAEMQVRAEAQRVGQAKSLTETAETDAAREAERKSLAETIELMMQRGPASLP